MGASRTNTLPVLPPNMQIAFYYRLQDIRNLYLHEALKHAIGNVNLRVVDRELAVSVNAPALNKVASFGLRGEVIFPVPSVIRTNPYLLGYYRLLYGHSQKEFYNKGPFGRFKRLEERGEIPEKLQSEIGAFCRSLIRTAEMLVEGIDTITLSTVHELQLLTLGPQLRGSENTKLGQDATKEVFELLKHIVAPYTKELTTRAIRLKNDSGRTVLIEFSNDPDVRITEKLKSRLRPLVSIEIKGGADASNIHNRLGESEKSHQKAKGQGFFEFWTIARVAVPAEVVKRASPTTSHFFNLNDIRNARTTDHRRFRELLGSIAGIRV